MKPLRHPAWIIRSGIYLIPVAILLCLSLPLIDQGAFRVDTGRYAAVGLDAWRRGDLVTLHVGELPYFNKPPLAFWVHGLVLHVFGVSLAAARLPTVLAAAVTIAATVGCTRELATRRAALTAGCVLALTYEFARRTREISLDMWLVCLIMLGAWLIARGVRRGTAAPVLLAGLPLGLALLAKPLVAILAIPALGAGLLWSGRGRSALALAGTGFVGIGVALPWYGAMLARHGDRFLAAHFGTEIADRARGLNVQAVGPDARPWWFYLEQIATGYWPWLPFSLLAVVTVLRGRPLSRRRVLERVSLSWCVLWLLALSAFADRADRYAIVVWPFAAMLTALWLTHRPWARLRPLVRRLPVAALFACLVIALAVQAAGTAGLLRVQAPRAPHWDSLFERLDEVGQPQVFLAGYDTETASLIYLETGRWPRLTRTRFGEPLEEPQPEAWIVYHERGGLSPGPGETVSELGGSVLLSRLRQGSWRPEPASGAE